MRRKISALFVTLVMCSTSMVGLFVRNDVTGGLNKIYIIDSG